MSYKTLNINGRLVDLSTPLVMGILNITPDSFYSESRMQTEEAIHQRIEVILEEGGSIIDIGGYSSRPGAVEVLPADEMERLAVALRILRTHYPDATVSIDTFRADVAKCCVEEYGAGMINDISAGEIDPRMFETIAALHVPYCMMHMQGTPQTMQQQTVYTDMIDEVMMYFARKTNELHLLGVSDILIDPGFGFSKTLDQNYLLMNKLPEFAIFNLPLLIGISRKSMIYKTLDCTPNESLNGTTTLNTVALLGGANVLRVHDVKAACDAVKIVSKLKMYDTYVDDFRG